VADHGSLGNTFVTFPQGIQKLGSFQRERLVLLKTLEVELTKKTETLWRFLKKTFAWELGRRYFAVDHR
jgi:hypothetical protein